MKKEFFISLASLDQFPSLLIEINSRINTPVKLQPVTCYCPEGREQMIPTLPPVFDILLRPVHMECYSS